MGSILIISSGLFVGGMLVVAIIYVIGRGNVNKTEITEEKNPTMADENQYMSKFISEHPNFTPQSIIGMLNQYAMQLAYKKPAFKCSQEVYGKAPNDENLTALQQMKIVKTLINSYESGKMEVSVVFTNNVQEYMLTLSFDVFPKAMFLENYEIFIKE